MPRNIEVPMLRSITKTLCRNYTSLLPLATDLNITKNGKVLQAVGTGLRSSRTGYTVTVFGAAGCIGRYTAAKLAKHGTTTVVPYRDDMKKRFLKVLGDLGVVNFVEFDSRNIKSIQDSVAHSDVVINCIGADYNTKNFSMADVNIGIAERIARLTKEAGVPRFIHLSSYNADPNLDSVFYATKGIGEQAVREAYGSDITIVRPSPIFAREDNLLNYLGPKTKMWLPNRNAKKVRPVYALDVAEALQKMVYDDSTAGQTYELYGTEYSYAEIREMIHNITHHDGYILLLPYTNADYYAPLQLLKLVAWAKQFLYWKTTNPDQIQRHLIDQKVDPTAKTFADLGIKPTELPDVLFSLVKQWRHPLIALQGPDSGTSAKQAAKLRQIEHFS